jgi:hypothetical protein
MIVEAYLDNGIWLFDVGGASIELPKEAMDNLICKKYPELISLGVLDKVKEVKLKLHMGYEVTSGATHCHFEPWKIMRGTWDT